MEKKTWSRRWWGTAILAPGRWRPALTKIVPTRLAWANKRSTLEEEEQEKDGDLERHH